MTPRFKVEKRSLVGAGFASEEVRTAFSALGNSERTNAFIADQIRANPSLTQADFKVQWKCARNGFAKIEKADAYITSRLAADTTLTPADFRIRWYEVEVRMGRAELAKALQLMA